MSGATKSFNRVSYTLEQFIESNGNDLSAAMVDIIMLTSLAFDKVDDDYLSNSLTFYTESMKEVLYKRVEIKVKNNLNPL